MNQLLNADGTPSFMNISDLKTNFEESFAKKQLGASMKDIVVKSISNINNKNADAALIDSKTKALINNSVGEIADKAFTNEELNGSSYIGGLKKIISEYASMESAYREDVANAILASEHNQQKASDRIFELFSTENLNFSTEDLKRRFIDAINIEFGIEGEDIVEEIGKDVGSAIAEAEEKNIIINQTSKVIEDQKEEIREELSVDDEDEDEKTEDGNDEEFDDSEDDGNESSEENEDSDEEESPKEETSLESYILGLESDVSDMQMRKEAIQLLTKQKPDIEANIVKTYVNINKNKEKFVNKIDQTQWHDYFDNPQEFAKNVKEKLTVGINRLKGHNRVTVKIPFARIKGSHKARVVLEILFSFIGGWLTWPIALVLWITDSKLHARNRMAKRAKKEISDYASIKVVGKNTGSDSDTFDTVLMFKVKLRAKRIVRSEGLEDYENEVDEIDQKLEDTLVDDVENGKVTIGEVDISHTELPADTETAKLEVGEHIQDGADGHEEPEQAPNATVSTISDTPDVDLDSGEVTMVDTGAEEFINLKYSNNNISRVIVPLSPTRLDMIDIPSKNALAAIYTKASESQDSLKNVIGARFNILEDIVNKESDEELTKKFTDYKKVAMEAFDISNIAESTLNNIGLTARGIEDTSDPISISIGSKAYQYLSHDVKIYEKDPKKSFESSEDAVRAAFDIITIKDAVRNASNKDTMIALANNLASREDLFWSNIVDLNDDQHKEQIKNILQLGDLDLDKKALVDTEFLTSIDLGVDTIKIVEPGKTEDEVSDEIFEKSKQKIESFLGKDINPTQEDLIRSMIKGNDTSDFAPTPFEKFIIKLGTDEAVKKNGGKDFELGQEDAEFIKNKAIVLSILDKFVDKLNPMNENDTKDFKDYIYN